MPADRPARILPAIVVSQLAGVSLWFAGNAVLPDLQREWGLGDEAVGSITTAVQLGFIAGTLLFAVLNISDRFSPRRVFLACALLGAAANASIALLPAADAPYAWLLTLRFLVGFFLAGIYPVGMKIAAGWYREGLGGALGYLIGAFVLGTALPHLVRGWGQALPWLAVLGWLSVLAALGGVVMYTLVPDGPYMARATKFDARAMSAIWSSRDLRASAFGYFGHQWELYTFWAFVPLMLGAYGRLHGVALDVSLGSFAVIASGAIGCVAGGIASRRAGSARVAFAQLSASGACCLASPLAYLMPLPFFLAFMLFWGIVVVGDSPQFSALTAAFAPPALVGSALTIVNCIGFAVTVVSIQATAALAMHMPLEYLFVTVAIGPAVGILACRRLAARPNAATGTPIAGAR